jgi:hypothetical protein
VSQTKFDKQLEENAESPAFGIGRFLVGRPMDGVRKTDATFWRSGTRVLPKVEGRRQGVPVLSPGRVAAPHLPHYLPGRGH